MAPGPRHHRHQDLRRAGRGRPLRDHARAGSRLHRPQGRHQRQHPRASRGSATRPPPSCCSASARSRPCSPRSTRSPGAKRKENLDRPRRRRPPLQAARHRQARHPARDRPARARSRRSPTARSCATPSACSSCATRCAGSRRRSARPRPPRPHLSPRPLLPLLQRPCRSAQPPSADLAKLPQDVEVTLAVRPPEPPRRARCSATTRSGASGVVVGELVEVLRRRLRRAGGRSSTALGARAVIAHDAKSLGAVPQNLVHDTEIGAYLLEPARRAYPFRELTEERGFGDRDRGSPSAADAVLLASSPTGSASELRGRGLTRADERGRAPARADPARHGARRPEAQHRAAGRDLRARSRLEADRLELEIYELAGEEFTLGSPRQLEEILFGKLGLSRKRRGKTGYSTDARVLQAIRDEHPIIPKIERWRELTKLAQTYLDALPQLIAADGRIHTTFNQTAAATGRLSSNSPNLQNIPIRTALGREIRACFIAEPGNLLVSADYSQVELRLLAQIADEDVLKEIFRPRRGRAHGHRHARVQRDRRSDRPRHALEGEDDQLRHRLRALRLRHGRPAATSRSQRPTSSSSATSRASPRSSASSRRRSSRAPSRATSRRCSAAAARCRSCAPAAGRCASRGSASPSTW